MALQVRRGTDAERQGIGFVEGEIVFATDTNKLYVGARDSVTNDLIPGGVIVSGEVKDDTSPQLGGDLDLNSNNIVGTGNINITGTITASGNINLGDGVEDNIIIGGQISSSLTPKMTNAYDLGDGAASWRNLHVQTITTETITATGELTSAGATINGQLVAENIVTDGSIIQSDSTVIYNGTTGDLTVAGLVEAAGIKGSVFGDDSVTLVDGISGNISNGTLSLAGSIISGSEVANNYDSLLPSLEPLVAIGSPSARQAFLIDGANNPLTLRGIADSDQGTDFVINSARYTGTTPNSVINTDTIGSMIFEAYNGAEYKKASVLRSTVESDIGGGNFSSKLQISVLNADGLYRQFAFQPDGVFDAGTAVKFYNASEAELAGFGAIAQEGSIGYGGDRDAPVIFDGTTFKTVTTVVAVPTGPTATGKAGQVSGDADYIYFCHSDNNWTRVAKDGTWT